MNYPHRVGRGRRLRHYNPLMIGRDIWVAAHEMITLYGDDAALEAASRADGCAWNGDETGYQTWKRVVRAINDLQNTNPGGLPN